MTSRQIIDLILMLCVAVVATAAQLSSVSAHTLGIDKADLIERPDGGYWLVSKVPANIAPAITAPKLPEHCTFVDNPGGVRGSYEVRFNFTCDKPLTAGDKLFLPWQREGVMLTVNWRSGDAVTRLITRKGATIEVGLGLFQASSGSWIDAAERYTALGIEHILFGIDHLLFVLGLLLIVHGPWMLLKTITAFTIAHSITLALATLGLVNLPSGPIEAAIALSIVFLAVEIAKGRPRRYSLVFKKPWLVAFAFGLLHGLGFAGALSELGLPQSEVPIALLFFNVGVEIGQLIFVAAVSTVMWLWRNQKLKPRRWIEVLPVYLIGTVSTYWFIERFLLIISAP